MSTLAMLAAHSPPPHDPDSPLAAYRRSEGQNNFFLKFMALSVQQSVVRLLYCAWATIYSRECAKLARPLCFGHTKKNGLGNPF